MLARKVIRITAEDTPNVRRALLQQARGEEPDGMVVVPNVLTWQEYLHRRATWDPQRQCEGLDARWYKGPEIMLFPTEWIVHSRDLGMRLREASRTTRRAKAMGIDPGEGTANTAWAVIDELGLLEMVSMKTPDTTQITAETIALMRKWNLDPKRVAFDRGSGKQHADRLRLQGYPVRTIAFGTPPDLEVKRGQHMLVERKEVIEDRYSYKSKRAQMYHELSLDDNFAIPPEYGDKKWAEGHKSLFDQLALFPKLKDEEGRYWLPAKDKRPDATLGADKESKIKTLIDIIGHSPDEADSLVLAKHVILHQPVLARVGAVV